MYKVMTTIVPISEMRDTTRMMELSEKEPVFITKNGYGVRVLMNLETYNRIQEVLLDLDLDAAYQKSEQDGKTKMRSRS